MRPAVGELARRMIAGADDARLGRGAAQARSAASSADGSLAVDESERPLVASSPAQAFALAGDLAALIDDMIIEGVPWERLDKLAGDAFDPYWRITLDFLKIAIQAWPKWLDEQRPRRWRDARGRAVEREIAAMSQGLSRGPTIIAGSTGTNRATARLIGAIARASTAPSCCPISISISTRPRSPRSARRRGRARAPSPAIRRRRCAGCSALIGVSATR